MGKVVKHQGAGANSHLTDLPVSARAFVGEDAVTTIDRDLAAGQRLAAGSVDFLHAPSILQDITDYRTMLRDWHAMLRVGGRLAIVVPHAHLAERSLALPVPGSPARKRLYTPAALLAEVEEALEPNAYRIRLLRDDAADDMNTDVTDGTGSIILVLERVATPDWTLATGEVPPGPAPAIAFEPAHTRREVVALAPRQRIVLLKLDHLGDFIMSIPALEKTRATFPTADITLVVGTWNVGIARDLGLFETVVGFDAFPRNSTEEKVDLAARVPDLERLLPAEYDLAIDLRSDPDTRFFLNHLRATVRAGIGTRAQFNFLDIFLPIDGSRHQFEAASVERLWHTQFIASDWCRRTDYRIAYELGSEAPPSDAFLVWGPYLVLRPGEYLFQPMVEYGRDDAALLFDVACDMVEVTHAVGAGGIPPHLQFRVAASDTRVEFRIRAVPDQALPPFSFYGGHLHRRGASSVLHQSEYITLLIELVAMRVDRFGLLREDLRAS